MRVRNAHGRTCAFVSKDLLGGMRECYYCYANSQGQAER